MFLANDECSVWGNNDKNAPAALDASQEGLCHSMNWMCVPESCWGAAECRGACVGPGSGSIGVFEQLP